jgi:hypothetical protein
VPQSREKTGRNQTIYLALSRHRALFYRILTFCILACWRYVPLQPFKIKTGIGIIAAFSNNMKLKTATIITIILLIVNALLALSIWVINTYDLLPYQDYKTLHSAIYLTQIILSAAPLIFFFLVLLKKQGDRSDE